MDLFATWCQAEIGFPVKIFPCEDNTVSSARDIDLPLYSAFFLLLQCTLRFARCKNGQGEEARKRRQREGKETDTDFSSSHCSAHHCQFRAVTEAVRPPADISQSIFQL
ncbi:uncharacterized protein LOC143416531 isoform X1 [Maylandia zebra]|uniref:uncharacterized protein LOC143416531 isoform X1 n=1 Tax=Maylandia zebra TaxID=106582 RepID=UPI00403CCB32